MLKIDFRGSFKKYKNHLKWEKGSTWDFLFFFFKKKLSDSHIDDII